VSVSKVICPSCGVENEHGARACMHCGAEFGRAAGSGSGAGAATRETRRVVTVLFSDVKGSTALGQELDPESLRALMQRYFEEMRTVLERHGGTVEKFIGDAVMAVFGVPQLHEDDALRAVRAAVDMRDALARLNEQFARAWGVTVAARIGVNTGEVIAGDPGSGHAFVVGEAVNLAARLEQAAQPGEILIGGATERLVRDAVGVEEVGPLDLKGMGAPVGAWRVLGVDRAASAGWARSDDAPLVGRVRELEQLEAALGRAAERGTCELAVVIGPAGVGKSRLVREFLDRAAERATIATGRCLPYGEGITFWPVVGVLREAAGIREADSAAEARAKLARLLPADGDGPLVEERLAGLLGDQRSGPGIQETFWAVRKLFERLASSRPLVVVFDDIQWGEPTFLDLLEYVSDWIGGAPVLLTCIARPELDDARPGWGVGKPSSTRIPLEPLSGPESEGLITSLLEGGELDAGARRRIAQVAEGNPLFLEQTLRMLVDEGVVARSNGEWRVAGDLSAIAIPPTIHAVLTARLDRLSPVERAVVERAAVVGRVFWWGAVAELSSEEERRAVGGALHALARKGLIRPDRSELAQEDAFRFTHILVRDAAYQGIPKAARAELHERVADWVGIRTRERAGEYEEIVGYHLEQAYRVQAELGMPTEPAGALGRRAAVELGSAGSRAFARGDMPAAVKLLGRAVGLVPRGDAQRLELLPPLAFALLETGDFPGLQDAAGELTDAAEASGDAGVRAHSAILNLWIRLFTNPEGFVEVAEKEATEAVTAFEDVGDERGLAKAWSLLALVYVFRCRFGAADHAYSEAARHARLAGDRRDELESLAWIPLTIWAGPTPAEPGAVRCRELLERVEGDSKAVASVLITEAAFQAGVGRFDEARASFAEAKGLLSEAALTVWLRGPVAQLAGWAELLDGDAEAAERELRAGYEVLAEIGEVAWLPTVAAILGEAVYVQGRVDEAEELANASESVAGPEDVYSQAMWRAVRAKVCAQRGEDEAAKRLAREAVALAETGDFLHLRWFAQLSLAQMLAALGEEDEAKAAALAAAAAANEKGNLVGVRTARALAERLDEPPAIPA
jgi:class 3 adenylate cyclase/tetratricopeptide (TPR) repeat protein